MYYFVPAWYRRNRSWLSYGQIWFRNSGLVHFAFDDAINQIRMFKDEDKPVKILTVGYFPSIGYFLFRHNIMDVESDNIFDKMQGIPANQEIRNIDYRDFNWPRDCDFVYNSFNILVYRADVLYARIQMGVNGNMMLIEFLRDGYKYRTMFFDWRGFLSSILNYDGQGRFESRVFLDPEGNEIFINNKDDTVDIYPIAQDRFKKKKYSSLTEMISEYTDKYIAENIKPNDSIIISASRRHDRFLLDKLEGYKTVLSFFGRRTKFDDPNVFETAKKASMVIADTNYITQLMKSNGIKHIVQMPPLDTSLSLGQSDQERMLKIFFMVSDLPNEVLIPAIDQLVDLMEENELVEVDFADYEGDNQFDKVKNFTLDAIKRHNCKYNYIFLHSNDPTPKENTQKDSEYKIRRIDYHTIHTDNDLVKTLKPMRLIVDLSTRPEIFLQVVGISTAIPQINLVHSDYVDNGENGLQINSVDELGQALRYYLSTLANWNQAKMYSVRKISSYSSERLVRELENAVGSES